jgi:hypothetical protein
MSDVLHENARARLTAVLGELTTEIQVIKGSSLSLPPRVLRSPLAFPFLSVFSPFP